MNLYTKIGEENIKRALTEFYVRAFTDPIIGHFFRGKNRAELTLKQIDFAVGMLGGPKRYRGRPLDVAHEEFSIRDAHFNRRQTLMREVLTEQGVQSALAEDWLAVEEKLRILIVTVKGACTDNRTPSAF